MVTLSQPMVGGMQPPTADDVRAAAERLTGHAVLTPLLSSPQIDSLVGGRVFIKAEPLQRTGSFKFRGAFNTLAQLSEAQRARGVVAWSSGNHAQALAAAAAFFGAPAVIVMPSDAPAMKIANTRALGAEVVLYDRETDAREDIGNAIARERGAVIVPPFDDPRVIAGQGTCGLEAAEQIKGMGLSLDQVVAPCSGGGLVAGIALVVKDIFPDCTIHAAEPEGFDDLARSLAAGAKVSNERKGGSICDALLSPTPGDITFPIHQRLLSSAFAVTDDEALRAMRTAFDRVKLVIEPGGAVALAAVLAKRLDCWDKVTVVVASGGNVDAGLYHRALEALPYA